MKRPELLSPAGSPEALRAAVQNGADAVYLGWGAYNARVRAKGFSDDEFREAVVYCHLRGVRVFLTLNTLLTDGELPKALEQARTASRLGVDAVLVQDWGLFRLLRRTLPDLPVHASTQMSVFTGGGAKLLWQDGCERIVLARECSREDFCAIREKCGGELELFSHGALCMCYSGQCAFSAVVGGRSGNRGKCAQPCRLAYEVDAVPAGERSGHLASPRGRGPQELTTYPLSLKDLCMASHVPELTALGVDCLKLEGRLKRAEYVAVVTSIYARLLRENRAPTREEAAELDLAFSRSGFTDGWWTGQKGPEMFGTRTPEDPESRGAGNQSVNSKNQGKILKNQSGTPMNGGQPPESRRDREEALFARARTTYEKDDRRTVPVRFTLSIQPDAPAVLTASDGDGHTVSVTGPVPQTARTRPLTEAEVAARFRKTGGTAFRCEAAAVSVGEGLNLPVSALNALRRDALYALAGLRTAPPVRREEPVPELSGLTVPEESGKRETVAFQQTPQLTVSVRTMGQAEAALSVLLPARLYLPLELTAKLSALPWKNTAVEYCAILPRVWRDREEPELARMLDHAASLGITGVLAGNIGHIPLLASWNKNRETGTPLNEKQETVSADLFHLYGDYGLNVFNGWSLAYLGEKGLSSVCASFELRMAQLRDMPKPLPVEALVYGHLPLMITENPPPGCGKLCGKCRKTQGNGDFDGGRFIDKPQKAENPQPFAALRGSARPVENPQARRVNCPVTADSLSQDRQLCTLTDRTGARFPVLSAYGGRTEIENHVPLWLADRTDWKRSGLAYARLRFTVETAETCIRVCRAYLDGTPSPGPFTRGLYDRGVE